MKRVLVAVLTLGLVGCGEESRLEAEDAVSVTGRAMHQDGSALTARSVVLIKEPDVGEILTGFTTLVGSMGLICLGDDAPDICRSARIATTDGSGRFSLALLGKDTQGSVGQASSFNLAVRAEARAGAAVGASRSERFIIQHAKLETPDLRLWEPQLSVSTDATHALVSYGALPAGATDPRISFVSSSATASGHLWSGAHVSGEPVDARLLEDVVGIVSVSATTKQKCGETEFTANNVSEAVAFTGRAGPPPSRHAACTASGASGEEVPVSPCTLTDGDFAASFSPPQDSGCVPDGANTNCAMALANHRVTVDLGAARPASLLVVRGVLFDVIVERSTDGETWTAVALKDQVGALPEGTTVRYVRVRSQTDDRALQPMAEVSVW